MTSSRRPASPASVSQVSATRTRSVRSRSSSPNTTPASSSACRRSAVISADGSTSTRSARSSSIAAPADTACPRRPRASSRSARRRSICCARASSASVSSSRARHASSAAESSAARRIEGRLLLVVDVEERAAHQEVGVGGQAQLVEDRVLLGSMGLDPPLRAGAGEAALGLLDRLEEVGVHELETLDHVAVELRAAHGLLRLEERLVGCVESSLRLDAPADASAAPARRPTRAPPPGRSARRRGPWPPASEPARAASSLRSGLS